MDQESIDALARSLTALPSRRDAVRLAAAGALGALTAGRSGLTGGEAKKKKGKKVELCHDGQTIKVPKKKKKQHLGHGDTLGPCEASPPPPPSGCTPSCDGRTCGDNGCGESCGTCGGNTICQSGQCATITGYEFVAKWGSPGSGNARFSSPQGIALDSNGLVHVVDVGNLPVQVFDRDGNFISTWGTFGPQIGHFRNPVSIAFDSADNAYVVEIADHRVQKFDGAGGFITAWGSLGSADDQFRYPHGAAVDRDGNVYVADSSSHRIKKFDGAGGFLTKWGAYGTGN